MSDFVSTTLGNSLTGIVFLALAVLLTFLMFYVWKFPFDHEKRKSAAPRLAINSHRLLGYIFILIYIFIMWNMVPRLWSYQIELPARTVLHLALGISIGALLFMKIAIVRYFKHMEAKLAPLLGSGLFLCSFLLIALVLPFSLREAYLESTALGDESMVQSRIKRVRELLPTTGLEDKKLLADLSSRKGLTAGRRILAAKCVQCHDRKEVKLTPPGTKAETITLVQRMIGNGLAASDMELGVIIRYLNITYVKQPANPERQQSGQDPSQPNISSALNAQQAAGMELYAQRFCIGCHGPAGKSPVAQNYPVLAGQSKVYLIQQFKDITSGSRNNAFTSRP